MAIVNGNGYEKLNWLSSSVELKNVFPNAFEIMKNNSLHYFDINKIEIEDDGFRFIEDVENDYLTIYKIEEKEFTGFFPEDSFKVNIEDDKKLIVYSDESYVDMFVRNAIEKETYKLPEDDKNLTVHMDKDDNFNGIIYRFFFYYNDKLFKVCVDYHINNKHDILVEKIYNMLIRKYGRFHHEHNGEIYNYFTENLFIKYKLIDIESKRPREVMLGGPEWSEFHEVFITYLYPAIEEAILKI